jgi:hypothetical protein
VTGCWWFLCFRIAARTSLQVKLKFETRGSEEGDLEVYAGNTWKNNF